MARSNTPRRNRQTKPANQGEHCQDLTQDKNRPDSILAAIDLGTNNCRMLIAYPKEQDFMVIDSFSRITRLGEGLSGSGCLSQAAMDRAINALQHCAQKMNHCGVTDSRHVATEACRRANNCDDFVERVSKEVGIKLEIISSDEEAGLALKGCKSLLNLDVPYAIIFDIGGGSTELIIGADGGPQLMRSVHMGCVSWTQQFFSDGELSRKSLRRARLQASAALKYLVRDYQQVGWDVALGASGSIRAVWRVGAAMGLDEHHITRASIEAIEQAVSECKSIAALDGRYH